MNMHQIELRGATLQALASGALWWPAQETLIVSDLHLGKSERMARRGGSLLPPYETTETLQRLCDLLDHVAPRRVICLGDSFDDRRAAEGLSRIHVETLVTQMAGRDWLWIEGNHDPGPLALGGRYVAEFRLEGLVFRHIAEPGDLSGEVSGHYHPKASVSGRGGRACFLTDRRRMILPAFGAYTGGMRAQDVARLAGLAPVSRAILTGRTMACLPVTHGG